MAGLPLPTTHRDRPLTFRVELEMAIATRSPYHPDPDPTDKRSIDIFENGNDDRMRMEKHIIKTLESVGLLAEFAPVAGNLPENPNSWMVKRDTSIMSSRPPRSETERPLYEYENIEIVSPIYLFCPSALQAVQVACEVLTATYRIQVNTTTGLHVHVGDGFRGFRLGTLKNLAAILWCFEPQIEQIHPPSRKSGSGNTHCGAPRRESKLARDLLFETVKKEYNAEVDVIEGLKRLIETNNYPQLRQMFAAKAYKFGDVLAEKYIGSSKRTVEFRQHKGSLDFALVQNWIRFTVGLVTLADTVEQDELFLWLLECIGKSPEECSLTIMLQKMNMWYLASSLPKQIENEKEKEELMGVDPIRRGMSYPNEASVFP